MKKLLVLSLAAVVFSFAASAQTDRQAPGPERQERHKGKHDKDAMMKELNLTKEQKDQLKAQHKEMKAKHDALKGQDNITVKEMRERQKALKDEQKSKMDAILTPEQKTKMDEMRKKRQAEHGQRKMKGGDQPKA